MKKEQENHHLYELCKKHMHAYVLAEMTDGTKVDGIITGLDEEYVYFAIPINGFETTSQGAGDHPRQFGGHGYGGGYGPSGGYGYPGYGYQGYGGYGGHQGGRFQRLVLPLTALAALSLLPWY